MPGLHDPHLDVLYAPLACYGFAIGLMSSLDDKPHVDDDNRATVRDATRQIPRRGYKVGALNPPAVDNDPDASHGSDKALLKKRPQRPPGRLAAFWSDGGANSGAGSELGCVKFVESPPLA